jgi:hypothetical protein
MPELAKKVGEEWKNMSDEEKGKYKEMADQINLQKL